MLTKPQRALLTEVAFTPKGVLITEKVNARVLNNLAKTGAVTYTRGQRAYTITVNASRALELVS